MNLIFTMTTKKAGEVLLQKRGDEEDLSGPKTVKFIVHQHPLRHDIGSDAFFFLENI